MFNGRGYFAGLLMLLAVLASPLVAYAEWLPGDALPMPEDALWQPMRIPSFGENSLSTTSFAEHEGKLIVVGSFGAIGRTRALGAVSWDGTSFERLGTPAYGSFQSVLSWNGALLAARGRGLSAVHEEVLEWNGSDWDSLATANGAVLAMQSHQGGLVVVGTFTLIGGVAAHHAAFFDGSAWHAMGTGISQSFTVGTRPPRIMSVGSDLYVQYSSTIHRYDGSSWTSNTGSALNGSIRSIATDGVDLYACGDFTKAGADSCPGVGRWDGSAWHRVGVGTPLSVSFITWWNDRLVGWITDGTSRVSALNGAHWQGLGDATVGVFGGELEACGERLVLRAEHRPLTGAMADVRVYDGVSWIDVVDSWGPDMTGTNFYTISAAEVNGLLYLCGGNRTSANVSGAIRTLGVSAWNGSAWSALGIGLGGQPTHIGRWGSDVIVTGSFTLPGGRAVARWDGTTWSALATNDGSLGSYAWDAAPFRDTLYGVHDGPVRRRSGSPWSTVGTNGGTNGPSYALLDWNDRLVVTGAFTAADGQPASRIASWDGTQWSGLGAGLNGDGIALCAHAGDLVVGGDFTTAGGQPATGVARWDGAMWHAMGTNALFIRDFAELAGTLYAAGVFRLEDDSRVNTVARWTGAKWQLLGSGVAYTASTYPSDGFHSLIINWVEGYQGDLYCGGPFAFAFGQVTSCIARLPAANTVAVEDRPGTPMLAMSASPNPSHGPMTMSFALPQAGRVRLVVLDIAGREVARLVDGEVAAGHHEVRWATAVPPGIYFALLQAPGAGSRVSRVVRLE